MYLPGSLFDRYRLCQITRPVRVQTSGYSGMIGKKLERHGTYQGIEDFLNAGDFDPIIKHRILAVRNTDDECSPCFGFGEIREGFMESVVTGADADNRSSPID